MRRWHRRRVCAPSPVGNAQRHGPCQLLLLLLLLLLPLLLPLLMVAVLLLLRLSRGVDAPADTRTTTGVSGRHRNRCRVRSLGW